jgi:hypothetical protein
VGGLGCPAETKTSSFDKLRMRFSTAPPAQFVLILSLSKDEDRAQSVTVGKL